MSKPRTSQTHPLQIAQVSAGPGYGRIGITFCPGKQDHFAATGAWERDLSTDIDVIQTWGAQCVITLMEASELTQLKVADIGQQMQHRGIEWRHLPIADFSTPSQYFEQQWIEEGAQIRHLLRAGVDILVHCKGGLGRAGMISARLLVELGMDPKQAIRAVRRVRPGTIETLSQIELIKHTITIEEGESDAT